MRHICLSALAILVACGGAPAVAPPVAPHNPRAVRDPSAAFFAWDPVPGATAYRVSVTAENLDQVLEGQQDFAETSVGLRTEFRWRDLRFRVAAIGPGGVGPASDEVRVPKPPKLTAVSGFRSAALSWSDAQAGVDVGIGRGPDAEHLELVAKARGPSFADTELAPNAKYAYAIAQEVGSVVLLSNAVELTTPLAAPAVTATPHRLGVMLDWPAVPGARGYVASGPGGTRDGSPPLLVACDAGQTCTYTVVAAGGSAGFGERSAPVSARRLPSPPSVTTTSREGKVLLEWPRPVDGDEFIVYRGATKDAVEELARTTATSYVDATAPVWTASHYRVVARHVASGNLSEPSPTVEGRAINAPDASSPGPSMGTLRLSYRDAAGQTFTVGRGGRLRAIEVGMSTTAMSGAEILLYRGDTLIAAGVKPVNNPYFESGASLPPGELRGTVFDLGPDGPLVSAGERLRFQIPNIAYVAAAADSYPGGTATAGGIPLAETDLIFRTYVVPAAPVAPILAATPAPRAVSLVWSASPTAVRYEVFRAPSEGGYELIGTTTDAWFVAGGLAPAERGSYRVRAVDGGGASSDSAAVTAAASPAVLDVANLVASAQGAGEASAHRGWPLETSGRLGQTFTVATAGMLSGIEVAPENAAAVRVEIYDEGGASLGGVTRTTSVDCTCGPEPLSAVATRGGYFDVSELGIRVTPGARLRFELKIVAPSNYLALRSGPDAVPGSLTIDGLGDSLRDLAFKTFVVPSDG